MNLPDILVAAAQSGAISSVTIVTHSDADLDDRVAQLVAAGATLDGDRVFATARGRTRQAMLWWPGVCAYVATDATACEVGMVVTERAA